MIDPMDVDLPEAERRELLELLLQEQDELPESFPVSFAQQRLWFLDQLDPGSPAYNLSLSLRMTGELQPAILRACLQEVVRRHEALRTVFAVEDGEPVQRVTGSAGPEMPLVDLAGLPAALRDPELRRLATLEERRPFDLAAGPLLRALLLAAGTSAGAGQAPAPPPTEHILVVAMHHIVSDGWSLGVFVREVVALYPAFAAGLPSPLPDLPIQYVDYAVWQRDYLSGAVLDGQLDYWRRQLAGAPPGLDLPSDRPRPLQPTPRGGSRFQLLPPAVAAAVRATVRREGVTLFMLALAAFDLLLSRSSGQEDLSVGTPIAGRGRAELEGLIGFFVNTLVLRTDLGGDPIFGELLARVRQTCVHAYDHQDLPFERLVEELAPERDLGRTPLFQVLFAVQNAPQGGTNLAGLAVVRVPAKHDTAKFDLSAGVSEPRGGLRVGFEFSRDLFDEASIQRLVGHFASLLAAVSAPGGLGLRLSEVPLLSAGERQQLLREWNPVPPPDDGALPVLPAVQRIAEQARRRPGHPAVEIDGRCLTYGDLDRRSAALALHLRALGIGAEVIVGVCCPRSLELVVAFVAILRAGGAYLPVDPAYPRERLELLLGDSGAPVVICPAERPENLPEEGFHLVRLDAEGEVLGERAAAPEPESEAGWGPAAPECLAYVIYTSGSTGRPKGVGVSYGDMAAHMEALPRLFDVGPDDRILQFASPGFDIAVEEMLTGLATGATLVMRGAELWPPAELLERFAALRLTFLDLPTAYWHSWVQAAAGAAAPPDLAVRMVLVGGEAMSPEAARLWASTPLAGAILLNGYGPTEALVTTSLQVVTPALVADWAGAAVPIGQPIEQRSIHVLSRWGSLQPAGVPGELCIGGRLARGYLGRPGLTAEKFVPDPWSGVPGSRQSDWNGGLGARQSDWNDGLGARQSDWNDGLGARQSDWNDGLGARLYRSGDLARRLPGGGLEFLGRIDHQVKVRGYRIELGEVEAALARLPGVAEAVAVARGDRLLAYVVAALGAAPQPAELRAALRAQLPDYMVPTEVVSLPAMPLTPNGKVDRRALPEPAASAPADGADGAPRTLLEQLLAGLWAEVLGRAQVSIHDSFFDLGGHSLRATQLLARVREVLRVEVPLRAIFEAPSVAAFARRLAEVRLGGPPAPPPLVPTPHFAGRPLPLSFPQERLWFLAQLEPDSAAYHIPVQVQLSGGVDAARLGFCLGELVRRHEALRTTFCNLGGTPYQVIAAPAGAQDFALPLVDLAALPEPALTRTAASLAREESGRPFDLAAGPLLRAVLLRRDADRSTLLCTQHHIVSDGWSMGVLIREMRLLYQGLLVGAPAALPPLAVQYADYAIWQRAWLTDTVLAELVAHWRGRLAGVPALLDLPADRPRPPLRSGRGARRRARLGGGVVDAVRALGRGPTSQGATPFMVLLAAFQTLLCRYTGQHDLAVGVPIANRVRTETEGMVGFFVNTLVLRGDLAGGPSFAEMLHRTRDEALDAFSYQDLPFEKLVEELAPARHLAYSPLFQVAFAFQNLPATGLEVRGLASPLESRHQESKFDLGLTASESGGEIALTLTYSTDLFDAPRMERLAGHFAALLAAGLAEPGRPIADLPLLSAAERHQLVEWNDPRDRYPRQPALVHRLFAEQAARDPDALALRAGEERLSYGELRQWSGRIAHHLRAWGVTPGQPVGLAAERSFGAIAALLGIFEAGGAYLPLDPALPAERLAFLVHDAGLKLVLAPRAVAPLLPPSGAAVLLLEELAATAPPAVSGEPVELAPEHPAYVLYTSGSTGLPKGVVVPHRALGNRLRYLGAVEIGPGDVFLHKTTISFDASVGEVFGPLACGAAVVLAAPGEEREVAALVRRMRDGGVTQTSFTPSTLAVLLEEPELAECRSLRTVLTGAEAMPPDLPARFYARLDAELQNRYGPTETTVSVVAWRCEREAAPAADFAVPIGRPFAGAEALLLDAALQPVPAGVPGELCIGGPCLATGYLGRPELTAASFVPHPRGGPGARLYRTGDLARFREDGALEFLGRRDQQVKLRGFRVELGEIEAALVAQAGVRAAAVLVRGDRLVAYLVPEEENGLRPAELRAALRGRLPEYLVPAAWVLLSALPLTASGKVDRRALPDPPDGAAADGDPVELSPLQATVAGIWAAVLGRPQVGLHDSFFDLGGHSLRASQLVSRVREALGAEVPLRAVFESPTVAGFAAYLGGVLEGVLQPAEGGPGTDGTAGLPGVPPLLPAPRAPEDLLPLSFAQERLWFLDQLEPGSAAYHIPLGVRLAGDLEPALLARSLAELVRRHESLRTTFTARGGRPFQVIAAAPPSFALAVVDLSALPEPARSRTAGWLAGEEARRPFDLATGPLLRARLLRLAGREHALLLTQHHIVSDGWSMGVLVREMRHLYGALAQGAAPALPPLPIQYADFAVWQRGWLAGEALAAQVGYWRSRLAGAPALLDLPADRPRPAVRSGRGARHTGRLESGLVEALRALGRDPAGGVGATPFMVLLAGFQALLGRYTAAEDLVVGAPIANRGRAETEGLIGFFVNTLVLRADLAGGPGFRALLRRTRDEALGAFAHQDVPFEKLVEELAPARHLAYSPLFQVIFALQNAVAERREVRGLDFAPLDSGRLDSKFDLGLTAGETGDGIALNLVYSTDLFDAPRMQRLLGHFAALLAAAAAEPERPFADLPLLSTAERRQLAEWGTAPDAPDDYPRAPAFVHRFFAEHAARFPESTALISPVSGVSGVSGVSDEGRLTYGELDRWADRIAGHLAGRGVGPGALVGLCAERSPAAIAGLLGIFKAGGAYLPLDPALPAERLGLMVEDAGVGVVLVQRRVAASLPDIGALLLFLDDLASAEPPNVSGLASVAGALDRGLLPEHPAYVLYTSGSTGLPKGVVIPHGALGNRLQYLRALEVTPRDVFLHKTTISFDASVGEVFGPLAAGAAVVLAAPGEEREPAALVRRMRETGVTQVSFTPSMLTVLLQEPELAECRSLRTVLTGGEAMPPDLPARFHALLDARLQNRYGPTETTVSVIAWPCPSEPEPRGVPIGRPFAGAEALVLDGELRPVPPGIPGELCIAGPCLATGYLRRPALTAESFVPHPAGAPGARLYRTGDLARFRDDGALEFLGRRDQQVKVRGFRVELGEVETWLAQHPDVAEAAVLARGDRLAAYLVLRPGAEPAPRVLQAFLEERMPAYMVPAAFAFLPALPLGRTGKLDRRALARIEPAALDAAAGEAPSGPVEETLAASWADVLGLPQDRAIGRGTSFFDLGGHSLLATQAVSRIREAFGVELPLRQFFEDPTLAGVAAAVEAARGGAGLAAPPIVPVPRAGGTAPLSFAQERLWFLDRMQPDAFAYNMPAALRLTGDLDLPAFHATLAEIVRRHEVLRTTFEVRGERPLQVIHAAGGLNLPVTDLAALPAAAREAEVRRLSRGEARQPFDLAVGPLLRAALLRLAAGEHVALLTLHHIVSDGWSMGILVREVGEVYAALVRREASPLPAPPVQYADFAVWQRGWMSGEVLERQLAYWRGALAGAPTVLELPGDRPRPAVQSQRGGLVPAALPAELRGALAGLARRSGATLYMVLLAGFQAVLSRLAGQASLLAGSTIANRNRREVEGLIGFFVNTLALRADLGDGPAFDVLLGRAREAALGAFAHQDLPFERLVEELRPERDLSRAPLVQVVFQLQNAPAVRLDLPGLQLAPVAGGGQSAKFDLVVNLSESPGAGGDSGRLGGAWRYNADLFDAATVARYAGCFAALLAGAAAAPGRPVAELPLLSPADRHQLLAEWGGAAALAEIAALAPLAPIVPLPASTLDALFTLCAIDQPNAPALAAGEERLTYAELEARTNRLARHLVRLGVSRGARVALCLERSAELVVALLAVLKAGAAYVPLDPAYPRERREQTLADCGAAALVATRATAADLLPPAGAPAALPVLLLDEAAAEIARESPEPLALPAAERAGAADPAYVIYTSGSTGRPKGVVVTHGNVLRLFAGTRELFGFEPADVWTLFHSYAFDFSVWELWGALLHGGRLVVVPFEVSRSPEAFLELLRGEGVTVLNQTPSAFRQLIRADEAAADRAATEPGADRPLALRWVVFGGEALETGSLAPWFARHGAERPRLVNMYGITETTVHVTFRALAPDDLAGGSVIGRPIPGWRTVLLDRHQEPVPAGVPGEIWVGGGGLAPGYLGRPDLTAERFVPDPFAASVGEEGGRLYRSGDLARWVPSAPGVPSEGLEYLGRIDHQVKIRGFRIELGEIEAALGRHPAVREAVVLVLGDGDARHLTAYLALAGPGKPAPDELRAFLAGSLPDYMLPAGFVLLDALPLTPNGKVDRRALAALAPARIGTAGGEAAPRTPLERHLVGLWSAALRLPETGVGIHDDFFALGGNSITGAVLVNRIQEELEEIVHVVAIFDAPTVAQMAAYLIAQHGTAVRRIWGAAALGETAAGEGEGAGDEDRPATEERAAELRRLVRPLVPLAAPAARNPPAVFVLSPPRSGSTLLRVLLGGHPGLFAPPELELLSYSTMPERRDAYTGRDAFWLEGLLRAVMEVRGGGPEEARAVVEECEREGLSTPAMYRRLQEWIAPRLLVDKTPSYALDPQVLRRAEEHFDGAFYVHLIRHPLGMIGSFEEAKLDQIFLRQAHGFSRRELAELIWLVSHRNVEEFLATIPAERQVRVRFEDLVRDPERTLRGLCARLGIDFDPAMVRPYEQPGGRMADGLHADSRMLGDVKFHQHRSVDAATADRWRERHGEESLGEPTRQLAAALGYAMDSRLAWLPLAPAERAPGATGSPVPLSFAQERLWFLDQLEPGKPVYNIPLALRLTGPLDAAALARSLDEIAARHEVLRTRFPDTSGRPFQAVEPARGFALPRLDLSALPAAAREAETGRLALQQARRGFDLARGPLIAAALLVLGPEEHALTTVMHHIVSDGWSVDVLVREVATLYRAFAAGRPSPLPPLPIQYADYALWQRRWLAGPVLDGLLGYWRRALAGARALQLPGDRPRPAMRSSRGGTLAFELPAALSSDLLALARVRGATPYMALLAGYAALLARWSGEDDVVIGTPVANRTRAEVEDLIGFFVNTLALRVDLGEPGGTGDRGDLGDIGVTGGFGGLLARVRGVVLGAFAHQDLPFERLVEDLAPERHLGRTPLVQVLFSFQNARAAGLRLPGLALAPLALPGGSAKFDLTLTVGERRGGIGGIAGGFEFSRDLFDEPTIGRLAGHLQALLAGLVADPDAPLSEASLLTAGERAQLLAWNDTARPLPAAGLATLFAETVRRAPAAPALLAGEEVWTYDELSRRANRLAHHLRDLGVGPEVRVGVSLERSPELVVALLAVITAGGAYVPVDAGYPAERRALMLGDSGAAVLVTAGAAGDEQRAGAAAEGIAVVDLVGDRDAIARRSADAPADLAGPDHLAYVMYTSGSTGVPKGAGIPQRAIVRLVREARYVELTPADRIGQVSNASFDALTFEVWGALLSGAALVMIPRETVLTPALFAAELRRTGVTAMFLTVALFNQMAREEPGLFAGVSHLLVGGEAVDPHWARAVLADRPPRRLLNGYGPTETTTFAAWYEIREAAEGRPLPIGHPLGNTDLWVLDRAGQPLPVGVPGQLFIGGDGLARGYHARPALTAERFVPHALAAAVGRPGARLYATGDLVRRLAGGEVEYLGRIDRQVKLRGFRIEPGEIEVALSSHPGVAASAALVREDRPGDRRLVVYVAPRQAPALEAAELAAYLRGRLPEYMVPTVFVSLPALPLTPNGKVDRAALPAPERPAEGEGSEGPRTPREQQVAAAWCEVLGLDRVGRGDDFFALGGHSLRATQLVSRLCRDFGVDLAVRAVFERPTVAGLAEHLGELLAGDDTGRGFEAAVEPIPRRPAGVDLPLSFAQERLWFIDQLAPGSPMYNLATTLRLRGHLDAGALDGALREIVRRHESLRTRFVARDGIPRQVIDPAPAGPVMAQVDLTALPGAARRRAGDRLAREASLRPFDLERGPLFRVVLLRLAAAAGAEPAEHGLLLTMHHIVSDGWSKGVLTRELTTHYAALLEGRPSPLPEPPIQYADFALWQRGRLQGEVLAADLAYWREQLAGAARLELPTDRPRPPVQSFRGGVRGLQLAPERGAALHRLCREEGTTLFMVLLAALDVLCLRLTGQEDVLVGSVIANRNRAELEGLIGFFVNTLALRVDLAGDPGFRTLLGRVREVVLGAFAHQDLPFERLVAEVQPERDLSRSPVFQVAFVIQNAPGGALQLPGLTILPGGPEDGLELAAKFDLLLAAVEMPGGGLRLGCSYAADLFEAATVARLLEHLAALLAGVTAEPATQLSRLPLLTPAEWQQLLCEWNDTVRPLPAAGLATLFDEVARRTPGSPALLAGDEVWSYAELAGRANRLAHHLRAAGVGPEARVAVSLPRSPDLVMALLAVIKAGGAYVPVDAGYPAERRALMLADSGATVLVTAGPGSGMAGEGIAVVDLACDREAIARRSADSPVDLAGLEHLAYVMYTSGSTGVPKGAAIPQRAIVRLVRAAGYVDLTPGDRVGQVSNASFDALTFEVWGALLSGASLVIIQRETVLTPALFAAELRRTGVTAMFLTVALFNQMAREEPGSFAGVTHLLVGGEAVDPHWARAVLADRPPRRLLNGYGPTETTTFAAWCEIREAAAGRPVPIGGPLGNTDLWVLDRSGQVLPVGVPGQLFIGGDGLARGYHGRPALTAERFVPHPLAGEVGRPGARLYASGDLVRRLAGGEIECLGRIDRQVKLRGFRIEPGEIEVALSSHPGVAASAVLVREDRHGDRRLVAYVAPEIDVAGLAAFLRGRLPEYMIPGLFVSLPALPLTPNGKVDRAALPAPDQLAAGEGSEGPRTPLEQRVAAAWCEVLGLDRVGRGDDFFALGGHSLRAAQLVSRLHRDFGVELAVRSVFERPTVAGLAGRLGELLDTRGGDLGQAAETALLVRRAEGADLPLSFAQERLWFIDQLAPGSPVYNVTQSLRLRGRLDLAVLESVLREIVQRHESLRTRFVVRDSSPWQTIDPSPPAAWPRWSI